MGIQIKATVRQIGSTTSEATARNHTCFVDRPEPKGGANRGPMGGELMLMGIGGCFMSNLLAAVTSRGLEISDLSINVSAMLEDAPPRFSNIVLALNSAYPDKEVLKELVAIAEANCIAVNTVKGSAEISVELA